MAKLTELYPPYTGEQPFIYLCFSDADAKRVRPLLERLFSRGCRIWYPVGRCGTVAERARRDARMGEARLVILYQTGRARLDQTAKSAVLVCQGKNIPIISIDTDDAESRLSMGLDPRAVHIRSQRADETETALLHAKGFSQELIGPQNRIRKRRVLGIAAAVLAVTLALAGAAVLYRRLRPPEIVQPDDTVFFSDPALTAAVRDALDGDLITEETLQRVTTIRLDALPENTDELSKLPNLYAIELNQTNAAAAESLLDRYEIVLTGGVP